MYNFCFIGVESCDKYCEDCVNDHRGDIAEDVEESTCGMGDYCGVCGEPMFDTSGGRSQAYYN